MGQKIHRCEPRYIVEPMVIGTMSVMVLTGSTASPPFATKVEAQKLPEQTANDMQELKEAVAV